MQLRALRYLTLAGRNAIIPVAIMSPILARWSDFALAHGVRLAAIFLIALILNRLLRAVTRRLIRVGGTESVGRVARMREQHTRTLAGVLYSAGTAVILIGAVLTALPEFGFTVTPIAVAAGLTSLAVGFGAQHLVRDLINGFFMIIEDQYIVGDTIRVGGVVGRVEHLTLRRTVIRDLQGALVSIPNGEISQVANLSRDWGQVFVDLGLPSDASIDVVLVALEHVCGELRADPAWSPVLVDGPRVLGVESLGPTGVTLRLQLRTVPGRQDDAARELRRRIQIRFEQEQIRWRGVQRVELVGSETLLDLRTPSNP
jgi:small-conductance mechanosensitive channel